jgi:hypothetical protein
LLSEFYFASSSELKEAGESPHLRKSAVPPVNPEAALLYGGKAKS